MTTIDDLLADAAIPVSDARNFDVGAALRRLAADAAALDPTPGVERAAEAGHRLSMVCRWILNEPDAAAHVDKIAEGPDQSPMTEDQMDVDGALVYACLLHLTGHPESAQFWWQLAAGASSRAAAYCLHLDHLRLGELREARHWYHQLTHSMADTAPPDAAFLEGLEVFARYARTSGTGASAPTGRLEKEVDRLASRGESSGIVSRPDEQLVAQLHEFTSRR
ncbi:hypothetical protein ACFVWP_32970 [Streptomyces sp. NPDC058175]|uniref:hypothetical protein n=1 Tax=Streptomyces sp. NPDC058175 TaxID=3346367 RepID=UPI0036E909F3